MFVYREIMNIMCVDVDDFIVICLDFGDKVLEYLGFVYYRLDNIDDYVYDDDDDFIID